MAASCPYCQTQVSELDLHGFSLRICPHCFSTFFPAGKTMAFRHEVQDTTREIWLSVLEKNKESWVKPPEEVLCIDHRQKLIDGNLPDYGIPGKVATCCEMFHLPPELLSQILQRTLISPSVTYVRSRKTTKEFALVRIMTNIVKPFAALFDMIFGRKKQEEDPFQYMQYEMKFKDILGPRP